MLEGFGGERGRIGQGATGRPLKSVVFEGFLSKEGNVGCISFKEAIVRGQMIFGSLISRLVAIKEIKCR